MAQRVLKGSAMKNLLLALSFLGLSTALGCTAVDRATDCQQICTRYKDCIDSAYNVSACTTRCRDNAANSESSDQRVDQCENCLDDRSCSSAVWSCAAECAGIVP